MCKICNVNNNNKIADIQCFYHYIDEIIQSYVKKNQPTPSPLPWLYIRMFSQVIKTLEKF